MVEISRKIARGGMGEAAENSVMRDYLDTGGRGKMKGKKKIVSGRKGNGWERRACRMGDQEAVVRVQIDGS